MTNINIRSPLKGFNRKSIAALVAVWVLSFQFQTCSETPFYFGAAYAAATVCIVLWVNHIGLMPIGGIQGVLRLLAISVYDLCALLILVVVGNIPFSLTVVDCMNNRGKVAELILSASSLRVDINSRIERSHTVVNSGAGMQVTPGGRLKRGLVTNDGVVVVAGDDPPAVIFLTPKLVDGSVIWKCGGVPQKLLPKSCNEE